MPRLNIVVNLAATAFVAVLIASSLGSGTPLATRLVVDASSSPAVALQSTVAQGSDSPSALADRVRREFPSVAIGVIITVVGLSALLLDRVVSLRGNLTLVVFGSMLLLYGARLLAGTATLRLAVGAPDVLWDYVVAYATYAMPTLSALFFDRFFGPGWKLSVRRVWQASLVYTLGAIAVDAWAGVPGTAMAPNNPIVIAGLSVCMANLFGGGFPRTGELRVVRAGALALFVLIFNKNLAAMGLLPWTVRLEAVGVLIFLGCLGYAVATRAFRTERQLAALEEDLKTARRIQTSILPRELPRLADGTVAVRYIPMAAVGGDFYEFLRVDDKRLGLLVADVTGHGVPAALIASMVKGAAAAQASDAARPDRVLSGINRTLCSQLDGHYVTAVYVYVDLEAGRLLHASAGHPPPLHFEAPPVGSTSSARAGC